MKKHKENILKLREEGKSYNEICDALGCSKATVSYHCGKGQKEKTKSRNQKNRESIVVSQKCEHFFHKKTSNNKEKIVKSNTKKCLRSKSDDFQRRDGSKHGERNIKFRYRDVIEKFGEVTECYLTGREIKIKEPRTYNFDHIVPATRGGDNSFENLGIACKAANYAKGNLMVSEFTQLCKEVLEHNGFEVNKK